MKKQILKSDPQLSALYSYLPYKPLVIYPDSENIKTKAYLTGICEDGGYIETTFKRKRRTHKGDIISRKDKIIRGHECYIENVKLMLRPLSDLTKDEYFKMTGKSSLCSFNGTYYYKGLDEYCSRSYSDVNDLPYYLILELLQNHFDIFGLIDKGYAVKL